MSDDFIKESVIKYDNDKIHTINFSRHDGFNERVFPLRMRFMPNGTLEEVMWFKDSLFHSYDGKPSHLFFNYDGGWTTHYQRDGVFPKKLTFDEKGRLWRVDWQVKRLEYSCFNTPSIVSYHARDVFVESLRMQIMDNMGYVQFHNVGDEPAWVTYHQNGFVSKIEYYELGLKNRLTGPALITYDENGREQVSEYYIEGEFLSSRRDWLNNDEVRKKILNKNNTGTNISL